MRVRFTVLIAMCFVFGPAFILIAPAWASGGDARQYRLAPGDRIMVVVFGHPDLSGDFMIDGTGNIDMPILGGVPVVSRTIEATRELLTARLANGVLAKPGVSVRLSELRPIYVIGDVRSAGSHPFRFGLTPFGALMLAGGVGSGDRQQSAAIAELIAAEERLNGLIGTRLSLLVRRARLEAERAGHETFAFTDKADGEQAGTDLEKLIKLELDQLVMMTSLHKNQIRLLNQQLPRIEAEIAAVDQQLRSERRYLQITANLASNYETLTRRGTGRTTTELDLQRQQAQSGAVVARLTAEHSRLEIARGELEIRVQNHQMERLKRILSEIGETELQLRSTNLTLPLAQDLLMLRRQQAGLLNETTDLRRTHEFHVFRKVGGKLQPIKASETTLIEPGDIVEVQRQRTSAKKRTASLCGSLEINVAC